MSAFGDIARSDPTEKLGGSAYMVQLSNGSLQNGLINADELTRALKINLLFFEEVHVSAPALLRNDVLNDLWSVGGEAEALGIIYREFIRPVLLDRGGNIEKVADAVIRSNLNIGFHRDKGRGSPIVDRLSFDKNDLEPIRKHAEFIKMSQPTYRYARSDFKQSDFLESYLRTVERYASISDGAQSLLFSDLAGRLTTASGHTPHFRVVDVIDVLNRARGEIGRYPAGMYTMACSLAFLTMELRSAPFEGQEFSASSAASFFIDEIENANLQGASDGRSKEAPEPSRFVIKFPVVKLLDLPFLEVLEVRDLCIFKALRVALAKYRQRSLTGPNLEGGRKENDQDDKDLWALLQQAGEFLSEYLSQDGLQGQLAVANRQGKWNHVVINRTTGYPDFAIAALRAEASSETVHTEKAERETRVNLAGASITPIIGFSIQRSESPQNQIAKRSDSENRRVLSEAWDAVRGRERQSSL